MVCRNCYQNIISFLKYPIFSHIPILTLSLAAITVIKYETFPCLFTVLQHVKCLFSTKNLIIFNFCAE